MPETTSSPKRLLVHRQQSVRAVLWALDVFGPRLSDVERGFVVHLGQGLVKVRDGLTRTERQLRRCERIRSRRMNRRQEATRQLRALMVAARGLVAHAFGPEKLAEVGFPARIEEGPEELLEQAVTVVAQLRDPGFAAPAPLLKGLRLDVRDLLTDLGPATDALRGALEDLAAARSDFTLALHDRNEALDAFNNEFVHMARIVEGLLRRAGLDDLAERVRPSTRRRGVTQVPFVEEDSPRPSAETEGWTPEASLSSTKVVSPGSLPSGQREEIADRDHRRNPAHLADGLAALRRGAGGA